MILLWGLPGDDPFDAVRAELTRQRARFYLLDQRRALSQRIELVSDETLCGAIFQSDECVELSALDALYTRVYDVAQLLARAELSPDTVTRLRIFESGVWSWADDTTACVINRPSAMASNGSKPYQAALIEAVGFKVPSTLITTDPEAVREFWQRHGEVVYKSVSSVRSRVTKLGQEHRERLADVCFCPTQFQAWIPGRDHRVHVMGDDLFANEVICDADDYRYSRLQGLPCELRSCTLPPDVAGRARALAVALDLPVCGIDLRRTPDGDWYCFEVNPSPCFTYYEHHTGQPLTAALASLLLSASRTLHQ
jgi:hypothetical protein